jgi:hypothetical protein
MLIKQKIGEVDFKKMHVTDNKKIGTKLLRVFIIEQADETITCLENSPFKTDTQLLKNLPPPPVSYGTLESFTVFTAYSLCPNPEPTDSNYNTHLNA